MIGSPPKTVEHWLRDMETLCFQGAKDSPWPWQRYRLKGMSFAYGLAADMVRQAERGFSSPQEARSDWERNDNT